MSRLGSFHELNSSIISSSWSPINVEDTSSPEKNSRADDALRGSLSPRASLRAILAVPYTLPSNEKQRGFRSGSRRERRSSVRPLEVYSLKHHLLTITKFSFRLIRLLVRGTSIWIVKFVRLMGFVVALMPAFVVFAGFYFITSDRIALPYIAGSNPNRTSRHFLDIYGSTTTTTTTANSGSAAPPKPVVIFFTGGAWVSIKSSSRKAQNI